MAASLCVEGTAADINLAMCLFSACMSGSASVCLWMYPHLSAHCVYMCVCFLFLSSGIATPRSINSRSCWPRSDSLLLSNIVSPWRFQLLLHWDPPSEATDLSKTFPTQQQISPDQMYNPSSKVWVYPQLAPFTAKEQRLYSESELVRPDSLRPPQRKQNLGDCHPISFF